MVDSDDQADTGECTSRPDWSWWRWLLVVPVFLAGWYFARWGPFIGTRADYTEDRLIWIGHTLAGFIPVFVAAKVAPSRQLPVAVECAFVLAVETVSFLVVAFNIRDDSTPAGVMAYVLALRFLTLTGVASAIWLVMKTRTREAESGWGWVWATGIALPVALFLFLAFEPKVQ